MDPLCKFEALHRQNLLVLAKHIGVLQIMHSKERTLVKQVCGVAGVVNAGGTSHWVRKNMLQRRAGDFHAMSFLTSPCAQTTTIKQDLPCMVLVPFQQIAARGWHGPNTCRVHVVGEPWMCLILRRACPARTLVFSALPITLSPVLPSVSPSFSRAVPNSDSCTPRNREIN